jgi:hypothetical protein
MALAAFDDPPPQEDRQRWPATPGRREEKANRFPRAPTYSARLLPAEGTQVAARTMVLAYSRFTARMLAAKSNHASTARFISNGLIIPAGFAAIIRRIV